MFCPQYTLPHKSKLKEILPVVCMFTYLKSQILFAGSFSSTKSSSYKMHSPMKRERKQSPRAWIQTKFQTPSVLSLVYVYVQQILNDFNKIKENMSNSRSKFRTSFLVTPTRKTDRAIVLKLLSVIHSRLKVDSFELLIDGVKLSVL